MALRVSQVYVVLREVSLSDKPKQLLDVSPKGTVPVLITPQQQVIEQSLEIMHWALEQSDPKCWLPSNADDKQVTTDLITQNDGPFKEWLDKYKYADRYPEHSESYYRDQAEPSLKQLEYQLAQSKYLISATPTLVDIAIMPFIRQFAAVDLEWFDVAPYPRLRAWLRRLTESDVFVDIMEKYPVWQPSQERIIFPASQQVVDN